MPRSPLRLSSTATLLALTSLCALACRPSTSGVCTSMGCMDQATLTAELSAAAAPLGTHEFTLEIDGRAATCTLEFTSETETAFGTCSEGVELSMGPATKGREIQGEGVVGYTEDPIPGEFRWQLSLHGQPKSVHVVHSSGGTQLIDRSGSFTYGEHRPNGPDCEPVCHNAELVWDEHKAGA